MTLLDRYKNAKLNLIEMQLKCKRYTTQECIKAVRQQRLVVQTLAFQITIERQG